MLESMKRLLESQGLFTLVSAEAPVCDNNKHPL